MPFTYNPHRHIKIWLSKNPNLFLNEENQMRLIKMRLKNPNDEISFVYDSSLLNDYAKNELAVFCRENNLSLVDVHQFTNLSKREQALLDAYKDEITHLDEGGNLAVASDILRWIEPVYTLGTYTDFDVPVDTSMLPETIEVDSPVLSNIGSLRLGGNELIISNNDYIAIVDGQKGKDLIEKVQDGVLARLKEYDSDFTEVATEKLNGDSFLYSRISSYMKNRAEYEYISKSRDVNKSLHLSSRELRQFINNATKDTTSFLDFHRQGCLETDAQIVRNLRRKLSDTLGLIKWFFFHHEYKEIAAVLAQSDEHVLKYMMKKERSLYMKSVVICTTGPLNIARSLYDDYVLPTAEFNRRARPMSFNHYGLKGAFQSQNSIPLHETPLGMLKFIGASDGELNDSSWLEEGVQLQKIRQEKLLIQKNEFQANLPQELKDLYAKTLNHRDKLEKESKGVFAFFGKKTREAKLEALNGVLKCFHDKTHEFNIYQFKRLLLNIAPKRQDVFAGLFFSKTQKIVESLEQLCNDALVFRIAKNAKLLSYDTTPPKAAVSPHHAANEDIVAPRAPEVVTKPDVKKEAPKNTGSERRQQRAEVLALSKHDGLFSVRSDRKSTTRSSHHLSNTFRV